MAKITQEKRDALLEEREKLLHELATLSLLINGSYFERYSTCTREKCRCHQGIRHGPRAYVAVTQKKKQRQYYIPKKQIEAVRLGVEQHLRLLQIVQRVTQINLTLMRGGRLDESGQR